MLAGLAAATAVTRHHPCRETAGHRCPDVVREAAHGKLLPKDRPESRPEFASKNGQLYMNGKPLHLKGINWYGFGTKQGVFSGLYAQPVSWFLSFLERNEFNAVRVPLDLDLILNDRKPGFIFPEDVECDAEQWSRLILNISSDDERSTTLPSSQRDVLRDAAQRDRLLQDRALNSPPPPNLCGSHLSGMTSLAALDWFIDQFAAIGILVLLDLHCLTPNCLAKDGNGRETHHGPQLFFDNEHPVDLVLQGWKELAQRFAGKWK